MQKVFEKHFYSAESVWKENFQWKKCSRASLIFYLPEDGMKSVGCCMRDPVFDHQLEITEKLQF